MKLISDQLHTKLLHASSLPVKDVGLGPLQLGKNFAQALQRKLYINSIAFQLKSIKTLIYMAPRVHIEYSIQEFEKCTSKLMKVLLFHKFKNICRKTILWTRDTNCFTIFVHRNFRRYGHTQSCEYHIVPRPRK